MAFLQSKTWRLLYLAAVIILIDVAVILGYRPHLTSIHNRVNGGTVAYTIERPYVLFPWECVPVRWYVDGIENVFFDDSPTVGESMTDYCPATANRPQPMLYVDFRGNFIQEYTLPLTVITQTTAFWLTAALMLLLGVLTFTPWPRLLPKPDPHIVMTPHDLTRRRFLLLSIGGLSLLSLGALGWLVGEQRTVIHDGWVIHSSEVK